MQTRFGFEEYKMKAVIILISITLLSGCAVYKVSPLMDRELNEWGRNLAANSTLSVKELDNPSSQFELDRLAEENTSLFQGLGDFEVSLEEIKQKYPFSGKGFQCYEPYLSVLSLGIIPSMCEQETTLVVEVKNHRTASIFRRDISYKTESVAGWIALFYAPSRKWSFDSQIEQRRVFYSLLNQLASETERKP